MGSGGGSGPAVQALIEAERLRARSNAGTTPLMFAVRKGDKRSVQAMLAAGADVNEKRPDRRPLLLAIINGHEDLVHCCSTRGGSNAEADH